MSMSMNKNQVREKLLEIFEETPVKMWLETFPEKATFPVEAYLTLFISHFKQLDGFLLGNINLQAISQTLNEQDRKYLLVQWAAWDCVKEPVKCEMPEYSPGYVLGLTRGIYNCKKALLEFLTKKDFEGKTLFQKSTVGELRAFWESRGFEPFRDQNGLIAGFERRLSKAKNVEITVGGIVGIYDSDYRYIWRREYSTCEEAFRVLNEFVNTDFIGGWYCG